jgi:hypothetical protein
MMAISEWPPKCRKPKSPEIREFFIFVTSRKWSNSEVASGGARKTLIG